MLRLSKCSYKGQFFIIAAALVMALITSLGVYLVSLERPSPSSLSLHPELEYLTELKSALCKLAGNNTSQTFSTPSQQTRYGILIYNPNSYELNNYQVRIDLLKAFTKAVNGDVVFDFYDDFNGNVLDTSKWQVKYFRYDGSPDTVKYVKVGDGYVEIALQDGTLGDGGSSYGIEADISHLSFNSIVVEYRSVTPNWGGTGSAGWYRGTGENVIGTSGFVAFSQNELGNRGHQNNGIATTSTADYSSVYPPNMWHIYKIIHTNTESSFFIDRNLVETLSSTPPTTPFISIRFSAEHWGTTSYPVSILRVDWIRVRKYASVEPATTIDTANSVIAVSNPNSQNLQDFQVYVNSTELSKLAGDVIVDIKDQNGNRIPFCYEHSNGECNSTPSDIVGIWIKVPNIPANSQIQLKYITLNQITNDFNFKLCYDTQGASCVNYCFEQSNGECNSTASNIIWVKVNLSASLNTTLYIIPSTQNEASTGEYVFDFYDDFNTWSGWRNYYGGVVSQDCATLGTCTLKKDLRCDPAGGYKNLGFVLNYPFVMEARIYRSYLSGCNADRIGVINNAGNGYGIETGHLNPYSDEFGWDKRTNYGALYTRLGYLAKDITYKWYRIKWYWNNGNMGFYVFDDNGNTLGSNVATDSTYSSFTRVYVFGGYRYFVDWIRIRKYAPAEPYAIDSIISTSNGGTLVLSSGSSQYPVPKNVIEAQLNLFITQIKKEYEERGDFINISYKVYPTNITFNITLYSPELYITASFTC